MNKTIQVPLSEEDINTLKAGDYVYLSGIIYTARDAAHKRMYESMHKGESLPIELMAMFYITLGQVRQERDRLLVLQGLLQAVVWISIPLRCLIKD